MSSFYVEMRWACGVCKTEMFGRHKKCSHCGKPKDDEPFYDAPGPVSRADAVTDASLLKQAKAGPDWKCVYCRCAERRDSGECLNCGAPSGDSILPTTHTSPPIPIEQLDAKPRLLNRYPGSLLQVTLVVLFAGLGSLFLWWLFSTKEIGARVAAREWQYTVHVERFQSIAGEGFSEDKPSDAVEVVSAGRRLHHHDKVRDGYRNEPCEEPYDCGETCTKTPIECKPNDNGFKVCSGGEKVCVPKHCSRSATCKVPNYKEVPVYQPWYTWKVWRWRHDRDVVESGVGGEVRLPSTERIALNRNLTPGQRERFSDSTKYTVTLIDAEGKRHVYRPRTLEEYRSLAEGQNHKIAVGIARSVSIVQED